jgi:hypothetical protein
LPFLAQPFPSLPLFCQPPNCTHLAPAQSSPLSRYDATAARPGPRVPAPRGAPVTASFGFDAAGPAGRDEWRAPSPWPLYSTSPPRPLFSHLVRSFTVPPSPSDSWAPKNQHFYTHTHCVENLFWSAFAVFAMTTQCLLLTSTCL